ncbi:hypothetical protein BJX64DRAFT_155277 [Aspergillus heterothallicus]
MCTKLLALVYTVVIIIWLTKISRQTIRASSVPNCHMYNTSLTLMYQQMSHYSRPGERPQLNQVTFSHSTLLAESIAINDQSKNSRYIQGLRERRATKPTQGPINTSRLTRISNTVIHHHFTWYHIWLEWSFFKAIWLLLFQSWFFPKTGRLVQDCAPGDNGEEVAMLETDPMNIPRSPEE